MKNSKEQNPKDYKQRTNDILSAWYALEVLSPQTFNKPEDFVDGKSQAVSSLTSEGLPWENVKNNPPHDKDIFYHILLGSLNMTLVNDLLVEKFGDDFEEKNRSKQKAAVAFITVDAQGRIKDDTNIAMSSFAWGYPQVLKGHLKTLAHWGIAESPLKSEIYSFIFGLDENGERTPLTRDHINLVVEHLREKLDVPEAHMERSVYFIQICRPKPKKKQNQPYAEETEEEEDHKYPDPPLLNSFYLKDLASAKSLFREEGKEPGAALRLYLGDTEPEKEVDILKEPEELKTLLSVGSYHDMNYTKEGYDKVFVPQTPLGRWPTPGGHSLILLQQAAVNAGIHELRNEGLMGVNGPPGTGKTTLLKDMVASVLVDRAKAMVNFDDPEGAFTPKGKIATGQSFIHVYDVDAALKGFEMIVASSNNKAVENITKELPLMESVNQSLDLPQYFKTTSDALSQKKGETWGLIAAAMGSRKNQTAFNDVFWHGNVGLKNYLKAAASSQEVWYEETCKKTRKTTKKIPQIILDQPPPRSKKEALERWEKARQKFNSALETVTFLYETLEKGEYADFYLISNIECLQACIDSQEELESYMIILEEEILQTQLGIEAFKHEISSYQAKLKRHKDAAPNLMERFFGSECKVLKEEQKLCVRKCNEAESQLLVLSVKLGDKKRKHQREARELADVRGSLAKFREDIERAKQISEEHFGDADFWKRDKEALHKSTAWLGPEIQQCRDELFIAAMELHRAFIDAAATPIRHNLMLRSFSGGGQVPLEFEGYIPSAWSALFMVVPVISMTFASATTMLSKFGPNSLGWLFVDEAGQASPQAAVGAVMRSKRTVMVGDPLQLEPVVTLSNKLTRLICEAFEVDPDMWAAPMVSAQGCADRASRYGTWIEKEGGGLRVGFPLLVHRRCENPMFSISNEAAYNNLMIHATTRRPSKIREVIGDSKWFHLSGTSQDKFCPEEGEFVVRMLKALVNNGIDDPDIYIITPFRNIADKIRRRIKQEKALFERMQKDAHTWVTELIGTVHTFQGKEAEAVFMVLGTQDKAQQGARLWAGSRPNLLNVAVRRAKSAFYVVGNHSLWADCGTFSILNKMLPVEGSASFKDKVA